jgi:hypothetical protein
VTSLYCLGFPVVRILGLDEDTLGHSLLFHVRCSPPTSADRIDSTTMASTNGTNGTLTPFPDDSNALFSPSLISPSVLAALPENYTMRPLQRNDFDNSFLDVLRVLTTVGEVTKQEFEQRFDEMSQPGRGSYHVLVILDGEGKIVGTGALVVEKKLYVGLP